MVNNFNPLPRKRENAQSWDNALIKILNFNPLPRKRENNWRVSDLWQGKDFNPLPRKRENNPIIQRSKQPLSFQSTPSQEGERDGSGGHRDDSELFQSTPSQEGEQVIFMTRANDHRNFNPLPRKRENHAHS